MLTFVRYLVITCFIHTIFFQHNIDCESNQQICQNRIHRECLHKSVFTKQEINDVKDYIQKRFTDDAKYKPVREKCSEIRIRKEFKCLTHEERMDVVNAFKQLYKNGVMEKLSDIHAEYYPSSHKSNEGPLWHRWITVVLDQELKKVDQNVDLPYWNFFLEMSKPSESIVWEYFGRGGDPNNNYIVSDGHLFGDNFLERNNLTKLHRQWNKDMTIPPFGPLEYLIYSNLVSTFWVQTTLIAMNIHFQSHLSIGGFKGNMSILSANYDPIFYLTHTFQSEVELTLKQLSNVDYLTPQHYNFGLKIDPKTYRKSFPDIKTDSIAYFNVSVLESLQLCFGQLCYVHDIVAEKILKTITGEKPEVPTAMKRMPRILLRKYFYKFYIKNFQHFDHMFPEIGNCNRNTNITRCKIMPVIKPFIATPNGKRQLQVFLTSGNMNIVPVSSLSEASYYKFMFDMTFFGYCSPYVI